MFVLVIGLALSGCTTEQGTQSIEAQKTEENQKVLRAQYPIPKLESSLELENLNRRLEFVNDSDSIGYIYLVNYGKVMAFYTIKGKVSSLNSYSSTTDHLVDAYGRLCGSTTKDEIRVSGPCYTVASPDLDGSYGENGDGIFFFTTEGVYVEWRGDYMLASQALKLTTQPELIREIK